MIKGIIFDLDGTLLNTLKDIQEAVNYALQKKKIGSITAEQTKSFIGSGGKQLIQRALCFFDEKFDEQVLIDFRKYYLEHSCDFTLPYDGITELIENLKKQNIKLAVATNKFYKTSHEIIGKIFNDTFEIVLGSTENSKLKPCPEIVYNILEKVNLSSEECLFIGDSEVDVLTAKNAKMKAVSVTWGYRNKDLLKTFEPDYMIESPLELLKIIKEINND